MARLRVACESFLLTVFHALSVHLARPSVGSLLSYRSEYRLSFLVCRLLDRKKRCSLFPCCQNGQSTRQGEQTGRGVPTPRLARLVARCIVPRAEANHPNSGRKSCEPSKRTSLDELHLNLPRRARVARPAVPSRLV